MKNILVIYYTQTGQLERALNATLSTLLNQPNISIDFKKITPKTPFPYPWSYTEFFDTFPETVHGVPCELNPSGIDLTKNYDLIIIGYQPWFLSVCIPINSFLQTQEAKILLKDKPVITIIACRNMWLGAQEKMKIQLQKLQAKLVGNITYVDKSANLISLITVLAFVLKGEQKKYLGVFPKYGVNQKDLENNAPKYGESIYNHLQKNNYETLQTDLINQGAVSIKGNLLLMEGRGRMLFPLYANYISKKGPKGDPKRKTRVKIFGIVLPTAIFLLSPIITIISRLAPLLFPAKMKKQMAYYSQNFLNK